MSNALQEAPNATIERVKKHARNLNTQFPRSPRDTSVGGCVLLARCVDKLRGLLTGQDGSENKYGSYHYNCPLDKMLFNQFGIDAQALHDEIAAGASDEEIGNWFKENARFSSEEARVLWNNRMRYHNIAELPLGIQLIMEKKMVDDIPVEKHHQINYFFDVYDVREGRY